MSHCHIRTRAATVLSTFLLACGGSDTPAADQVRAADSALSEAIAARDLDRTLAFYSADASILPAAKPAVVGLEAIRAEWTALFAIPEFKNSARLLVVEVSNRGDLAYTRGTYETLLTGQDLKPVTELGKWVTIWRRQADGSWRVVVEIYNTDTPPPDHI